MEEIFRILIGDINPKSWISPFKKTAFWYVLLLLPFYVGISYVTPFMFLTPSTIPFSGYPFPHPSYNFVNLVISVIFEETLFFGLPFYISKNHPYVMLICGIMWAIVHLFITVNLTSGYLDITEFLGVTPMLFFYVRAWRTNYGWLAILIHLSWDIMVFEVNCAYGIQSCSTFGKNNESIYILMFLLISSTLLGITGWLYKIKKSRKLTNTKF